MPPRLRVFILEGHLSAKVYFDAHFMEHCGLDGQRKNRTGNAWRIGNADMVCPVSRHQRIARDAMENRAYQGPLRRSALPAAGRLLSGQFDDVTPGFTVEYSVPNSIYVKYLPEPATASLSLIALVAAMTGRPPASEGQSASRNRFTRS